MEYPLLREMAVFSPLRGVLRDTCRPFDDRDPLSRSLHGLFCLFFHVWRECGPVPAGWSVWRISDCYHRSLVGLFSKSIAPSAYVQVHPEDGESVVPLRSTSLISWGGILFKLPASDGAMMTRLSPNRDLLLQGVS